MPLTEECSYRRVCQHAVLDKMRTSVLSSTEVLTLSTIDTNRSLYVLRYSALGSRFYEPTLQMKHS